MVLKSLAHQSFRINWNSNGRTRSSYASWWSTKMVDFGPTTSRSLIKLISQKCPTSKEREFWKQSTRKLRLSVKQMKMRRMMSISLVACGWSSVRKDPSTRCSRISSQIINSKWCVSVISSSLVGSTSRFPLSNAIGSIQVTTVRATNRQTRQGKTPKRQTTMVRT